MMGRGKGKVKRSSAIAHREDGSGEEEKLPVKRRGRPTKAHKEDDEEIEKIDQNDVDTKHEDISENRNKRKKQSSHTEESSETVKDENDVGPKTNGHELTKLVGFRHNGSRRKNKPRRAAEVGVSLCEACSWVVLRS